MDEDDELRKALDAFNQQIRDAQIAGLEKPTQGYLGKAKYPIKSRAMAVHPKQIKQAEEAARKAGVPTEFTPGGRAIITSNQHMCDYAKTRGCRNLDSYTQ